MLGVYIPKLRVGPRWAAAASVSGFSASLIWVAAARHLGTAPLGIEPPFPGLVLSALVWTVGRISR